MPNQTAPPRLDSRSPASSAGFLLLLAAVVVGTGFYRIGFGIDLRDEGFYLAAPARYALGDLPFRNEILNPHRMFDLLLWPVFAIFPDVSVYALRTGWLLVELTCAVALWSVFRRFIPGALAAGACAATLYVPNLIWTPGYHVMAAFLFALSWSMWLAGCLARARKGQIAGGVASGVAFCLAGASYLPLLLVECVPAAVLLSVLRRGSGVRRATAGHLVTVALLAASGVAVLVGSGLLPDWLEAQSRVLGQPRYSSSVTDKLALFGRQLLPVLPTFGCVTAFVTLMLLTSRARLAKSAVTQSLLCAAPIAAGLVALRPLLLSGAGPHAIPWYFDLELSMHLAAASLALHAGAWIARAPSPGRVPWEPRWRLVYTATTSASILLAILFGLLSGQAYKTMFAIVPLTVAGVAMVHRELVLRSPNAGARRYAWASAALALGLAIPSYGLRLTFCYGDARVAKLQTPFSHPRLAGIRSTESRVRMIEAVADQVSTRVAAGSRILISAEAPLFYYLTATRPALDYAWHAPEIRPETKRESLRRMTATGPPPRFALRLPPGVDETPQGAQRIDPVDSFITRHYEVLLRIGTLELWQWRGR